MSDRDDITGADFEAIVALRTMERVFSVLESGDVLGFGWAAREFRDVARTDRLFARFRALRDDLKSMRASREASKSRHCPVLDVTRSAGVGRG